MMARLLLFAVLVCFGVQAQTPCPPTPIYGRCELVFELNPQEMAAHPKPYVSVQLNGEFRSPRHRTLMLPAFWDGENRMVIRFAPIDAGEWTYRITSNIGRWDNQQGKLTAEPADVPGFIRPANGHHWRYTESQLAHLWMGDTSYGAGWLPKAAFQQIADTRAEQKFTHMRGLGIGHGSAYPETFKSPDEPYIPFYQALDERIAYLNSKGIIFDMILGGDDNHLRKVFPEREQRERYIRYMVGRYSAFNVTWELMQEWEEYENGRELCKELGMLLKNTDPYNHPRSTHAQVTSAPLLPDGWMDYVIYQSSDNDLGSIEHQLYAVPFVNAEFAYENSGGGGSEPHHVSSDDFRRRLWNTFMNGQYPVYGNTATLGAGIQPQDLKLLNSPGATAMTVWYDIVSSARYWELEPYFDTDGGRAIGVGQLILDEDRKFDAVEFIVYVERPSGPIEVRFQKRKYTGRWINPSTGDATPIKEFNSDKFIGEPPSNDHDWVLHISREGRKKGMLRSYKFESRPFMQQEIESSPKTVPYVIAAPTGDQVSLAMPPHYETKVERQSRGTRSMRYLWTGEVTSEGHGYRVLGTGPQGTWHFSRNFARNLPAVMNVRVYGMNANGKVYVLDRIYRVTR